MFLNPTRKVVRQITIVKTSTPTQNTPNQKRGVIAPSSGQRSVSGSAGARPPKRPALSDAKRATKRRAPIATQLFDSDDESDGDGDFTGTPVKRAKADISASTDTLNIKRRVPNPDVGGALKQSQGLIHGADLTSRDVGGKFFPAFEAEDTPSTVSLVYPSSTGGERFQLVDPEESDGYKSLDDIIQTVEQICAHYFPPAKAAELNDDIAGFSRRLKRAHARSSAPDFIAVVEEFSKFIKTSYEKGETINILEAHRGPPLPLVERILSQVYSRTVSPRVESLRQYENGTDNVYGEMLPRFASQIFKDTDLRPDSIFIDLGSGVGNVVLQAALEIGCESWGCEIMPNPNKLAALQAREFHARCGLWGMLPGKTHLIRGDFLEEQEIGEVLKKADVILVNNQAFNPDLNDKLTLKFLDLKEGAKIVSLKSFVPSGFRMQERTMHDPRNLLSVVRKEYGSRCVSWTDSGGEYFIATKDSKRLEVFQKKLRRT